LTAYSLESRAGFVSHRQRSWDSPFGGFPSREVLPAFRPEGNPHTVTPGSISATRRCQTGLTGPGSWVYTSRECLATTRSFSPVTAGASHGVCPSRVCHESLKPGLLRASSHTLRGFWRLLVESVGVSEYQSALAPLHPTTRRSTPPRGTTLLGFLHLPAPEHSRSSASGLLGSPRVASCITADYPTLFGRL
jgi:hypothetical protein